MTRQNIYPNHKSMSEYESIYFFVVCHVLFHRQELASVMLSLFLLFINEKMYMYHIFVKYKDMIA